MRTKSAARKEYIVFMNNDTLLYWHKLENFYPYILEEQHNEKIKSFKIARECDYPDLENPTIQENNCVRYYEVYLGIFRVKSALDVIAKQMNAEKEFRDDSNETSCFCKFRLKADGKFDETSFRISSFPWAINRVKQKQIELNQWDDDFHEYETRLFMQLFAWDEVVDYEKCRQIVNRIKSELSWNIEFSGCWMRIDRVVGEKKDNQSQEHTAVVEEEDRQIDELIKANDLLNSFYVRDLENVINNVSKQNYGQALEQYLNHNSDKRIDVEHDKDALFAIFDPKTMPYGKWPSGYSLRSMQQLAVNIAMNQKEGYTPVFSVNGPPGTGKTTLLRDVVAANVVERAIALCEYEKPDDAFVKEIGIISYNRYNNTIKEIDDKLKKYTMLVVTNNNAAAKNITMELPDIKSISKEYQDKYTYFNQISDQVLKRKTWGMCAAALGNRKNCSAFIDVFWPLKKEEDEFFDFNRYLRTIQTQKTAMQYKENWKAAKDRFSSVLKEVQTEYSKMDECYCTLKKIRRMQRNISEKERKLRAVRKRLSKLYMEKGEAEKSVQELEMQRLQMQKQKDEIRQQVLFFKIRYWICPKNEMIVAYKNIEKKENKCLHEKFEKQEKIRILIKLIKEKEDTEKQYGKEIEEQKQKIELQNQQIDNFKKEYDEYVPDDDYLMKLTESEKAQEYKTAQEKAPWNGKEINKLRETLFLEAMNLQRAFVENSSQMRDQLDAFSKMMRGNLSSTQLDKYAASLFQGFALAVPVISSTFASIGSFLRYVGREDIGLVLADESGQAMPQAAAGVIWRCRRVIAVGDPLQIEPVVTIHDKTIEFLKNYYKQSAFIASKTTSVQSLADAANNYIGIRELDGTNFYVGSPLLVHGRCQKRIFDIANIIAYNETMIYNTVDREESVCAWIDVKGQSQNKHFVLEQAKRILPIIKNEFIASWNKNGKSEIPSLFIISPFRNVKAGLASYYRDNDFLYHNICESNDVECKQNIKDWIRDNIGTIHTFQGKEADTVIICLGVDSGEKENGAVEWACGRPNILNVAVTRAKNNLYIVGDADKWASKPYFSTAYELCEKCTDIKISVS